MTFSTLEKLQARRIKELEALLARTSEFDVGRCPACQEIDQPGGTEHLLGCPNSSRSTQERAIGDPSPHKGGLLISEARGLAATLEAEGKFVRAATVRELIEEIERREAEDGAA